MLIINLIAMNRLSKNNNLRLSPRKEDPDGSMS